MPLVYQRWQLKNGADRARFGDMMLEACRRSREEEGVRSARYYWTDANTIAILTDYEQNRHVFAAPARAEVTKLQFAISDIADRTAWEVWADARAGTNAYNLSR